MFAQNIVSSVFIYTDARDVEQSRRSQLPFEPLLCSFSFGTGENRNKMVDEEEEMENAEMWDSTNLIRSAHAAGTSMEITVWISCSDANVCVCGTEATPSNRSDREARGNATTAMPQRDDISASSILRCFEKENKWNARAASAARK